LYDGIGQEAVERSGQRRVRAREGEQALHVVGQVRVRPDAADGALEQLHAAFGAAQGEGKRHDVVPATQHEEQGTGSERAGGNHRALAQEGETQEQLGGDWLAMAGQQAVDVRIDDQDGAGGDDTQKNATEGKENDPEQHNGDQKRPACQPFQAGAKGELDLAKVRALVPTD